MGCTLKHEAAQHAVHTAQHSMQECSQPSRKWHACPCARRRHWPWASHGLGKQTSPPAAPDDAASSASLAAVHTRFSTTSDSCAGRLSRILSSCTPAANCDSARLAPSTVAEDDMLPACGLGCARAMCAVPVARNSWVWGQSRAQQLAHEGQFAELMQPLAAVFKYENSNASNWTESYGERKSATASTSNVSAFVTST